jgi:hypothetical protein
MAKGGLFAVMGPPALGGDEEDDFSDDALPPEEDGEAAEDVGGGPFEAYCKTIFDDKADYQSRCDALREAISTMLEERG